MAKPIRLYFPTEKAIYLLTRETVPGEGGDKKKFWREVLGFDLPELVQEAILSSLDVEDLKFKRSSQHGGRYEAVNRVQGRIESSRLVKTAWIVHPDETIARFVTAFPQK